MEGCPSQKASFAPLKRIRKQGKAGIIKTALSSLLIEKAKLTNNDREIQE